VRSTRSLAISTSAATKSDGECHRQAATGGCVETTVDHHGLRRRNPPRERYP
jgi:hypothetical protein